MNFSDFSKWPDWLLRFWKDKEVPIPMLILAMAEKHIGAVSMARDRASYGEWPDPVTAADFLAWIENEEQVQRDESEASPHEASERLPEAELLGMYAKLLRATGVKPAAVFDYEYLRHNLAHRLAALAQRVNAGEDFGKIFDGVNLFHKLLVRTVATNRAASAERDRLLNVIENSVFTLRDLVLAINLGRDGSYFIRQEAQEDVEAAHKFLQERLGENWTADLFDKGKQEPVALHLREDKGEGE